jgi:hypothetical protein
MRATTSVIGGVMTVAIGLILAAGCSDDDDKGGTTSVPVDTIPAITAITPSQATAGSVVRLRGKNLDLAPPLQPTVRFGTLSASVTEYSDTSVRVIVPLSAGNPVILWLGTDSLHAPAFTYVESYRIWGQDMGPMYENVYVQYEDQQVTNAVITVNGTPLTFSSGGYRAQLPDWLDAGSLLDMQVAVNSYTFTAQGTVPPVPVITAPAANAVRLLQDSLLVQWTLTSDVDTIQLSAQDDAGNHYVGVRLSGSARQAKVDVSSLGAGDAHVCILVYHQGVFSGQPLHGDCEMSIRSEACVDFVLQ